MPFFMLCLSTNGHISIASLKQTPYDLLLKAQKTLILNTFIPILLDNRLQIHKTKLF